MTTTGGQISSFNPNDPDLRDLAFDGAYLWMINSAGTIKEFTTGGSLISMVKGDATNDFKVDGGDLALWQQHYDPLGLNADNNTFAMGDWNGDGKIDGGDLALWQQYYNPLGPPTGVGALGLAGELNLNVEVPEPATMLILGTGVLGIFAYYRRRRMK